MTRLGVISDEFWTVAEPLTPSLAGKRGGRFGEHRLLFGGDCRAVSHGMPVAGFACCRPWRTVWSMVASDGTHAVMFAQAAQAFGFDAETGDDIGKLLSRSG